MKKVIGTCSLCGGAVTVPAIWHGVVPPVPQCESCYATKKQPHGPVIDMEAKSQRETPGERVKSLFDLIESDESLKGFFEFLRGPGKSK